MADRRWRHRTIAVDVDAPAEDTPVERRDLPWPWWLIAGLGAVAVVAFGWLLLAGASVLGWVNSPEEDLAPALLLATRVLLLGYGTPVTIGGQLVTLVPLTWTIIQVLLGQPLAAMAARQLASRQATVDDTGRLWVNGQALVIRVAGTYALVHAATVGAVALGVDGAGEVWRAALGGLVVGAVAGVWGASRAIGHDPRDQWPVWLRSVPVALGTAVLVCLAAGAAVVASSLFLHLDRVAHIHDAIAPDLASTLLVALVQLLYLPNLALWGTGWSLGAGITLGDGSLLNLNVTDVGFLPAIPVLGAIPEQGLAPGTTFGWLVCGVVAGAVAAVLVLLPRPRARFDVTTAVGAAVGIAAGLLVAVACSLSSGGLGGHRLAHLGPLVGDLFVVAPSILGLGGLVTGLVVGLVRPPHTTESDEEDGLG